MLISGKSESEKSMPINATRSERWAKNEACSVARVVSRAKTLVGDETCVEKDESKSATLDGGPVEMPMKQFFGELACRVAEPETG